MSTTDAVLLKEAHRLVVELGNEIWPGFAEVPMPIVLVAGEREYLVGWPGALPEGFEADGIDARVGRSISVRPRTFDLGWSASFPAFGLPAVVVIGTAEATGKTPTEWVLTVLHEHLHQLQYGASGYYSEVEALDLANGDETGMWMLDYPFPYDEESVGAKFAEVVERARKAMLVAEPGTGPSAETRPGPWPALRGLLDMLEPADARYLSFQLWQEGVGRYVELRAAQVAASAFTASARFIQLEGSIGWDAEAEAVRRRILSELEGVDLAGNGRVSFYALGAALGVLLDRDAPGWKKLYLEKKFALEDYVPSD